jgi:predicted RNA binding protein YcfA (HicA-like mRNA interferase family)
LARLRAVTWRQLVERLRELGFEGPFQGGKHPYMIKDDVTLTLPNRHRDLVSVDLVQRIL